MIKGNLSAMNNTQSISLTKQSNKRDFAQRALILLYVVHLMPVLLFVMGINARIGLGFLNPNLKLIVSIFLILLSISCIYKRLRWWDYLIVIVIGVFCFWSPAIYAQTRMAVLLFAPDFVFSCLPLYLLGATVQLQEDEETFALIGRCGVIVIGFFCITAILGLTGQVDVSEEKQGMAYNMLPMVIITTINAARKHKSLDRGLLIVGVLLLLSMGARGPVLTFTLFIIGYVFLFKRYKNAFAFRMLILGVGGLLFLFIDYILELLKSITISLGMSTRIYEMISGNEMINTENRDWIYDTVRNELNNNPIFGHGFFYDRTLFGMESDSYAHNVFYEIYLDFGFYIGTVLFIIFFGMMIWSMKKYWGSSVCGLLFGLFCGYFVMFVFSESIFRTPSFWFFVGILVSTFRSKSRKVVRLDNNKYISN